jgi:non-ribosomal peptide synthetase component E (peptide arylation enzyme)
MNLEIHPAPDDLIAQWREDGWWSDRTLRALFDGAVARHPGTELMIVSDERPARIDLAAFDALLRRIAGGLAAIGVVSGDVFAVLSPGWLKA